MGRGKHVLERWDGGVCGQWSYGNGGGWNDGHGENGGGNDCDEADCGCGSSSLRLMGEHKSSHYGQRQEYKVYQGWCTRSTGCPDIRKMVG